MKSAISLEAFAALRGLSAAERGALAKFLKTRRLSAGETLFDEGDESAAWILLARGEIRVSSSKFGQLGDLSSGETLGSLSLFQEGRRQAGAVSCGDSSVYLLQREQYQQLAAEYPRIACRIAGAILADLAEQTRAALVGTAPPPR